MTDCCTPTASETRQLNLQKKQVAFIRSWETKNIINIVVNTFFQARPQHCHDQHHFFAPFSTTCKKESSSAFLFHTDKIIHLVFCKNHNSYNYISNTEKSTTEEVVEWMKEEKFTALSHVGRWRGASVKPSTPIYRQYLILQRSIHKNLFFFLLLDLIQLGMEGQLGSMQKNEPVTC